MAIDIDSLKTWIGRTAEAEDIVTPRLVAGFQATFAPNLASVDAADAPVALHWCLAPSIAPMSELGRDGHPAKGGFLPPVQLPLRMWAGGEVQTFTPLQAGDIVTRKSLIEDVTVKEGRSGTLCFVAVRHNYRTTRGLAVSERHDIVYREANEGQKPAPVAHLAPQPQHADLSWKVEGSSVLLFRYSALTFNGHRIHYDHPYATGVEGYAGLVVHGPIQATLLMNIATMISGRVPSRFRYRGLSPLIASNIFTVSGHRCSAGGVKCWTQNADGRICMEAKADG